MQNGINYFKSKRLKFICVCNPFKINYLQRRDKLSLDITVKNVLLVVGFSKVRLNNEIKLRKPEQSFGNLPSLNLLLFGLFSLRAL